MPVSEVEEAINRMLVGRATLLEIEAFIERLPISEEQKSVLRLWARASRRGCASTRPLLPERVPAAA